MTVTTTDRIAIYRGNGVATAFPFDFIIPEAENLSVSLYDFATGELIQVLAPGSYSVVGINNPTGGTVTYPLTGPAVPNTQNLVILRTMPFTQETNIRNQGGFFPEIIEIQLDAIVMQIQQLAEVQSRSMVVNPGQDVPDISVIESAEQFALNAQASAAAADASADAAAASAAEADAAAQAAIAAGVVIAEFTFNTATSYPPAVGELRFNNATQNSATLAYISHMSARGVDLTNIIPLVFVAGSTVLIQDANVIGNYKIYTISGPPVLSGADYQLPIVFKSGGTSLVNGSVFATLSGGGGASSVYVGDNPPPLPLQNGQLWFKSSTGIFYVYYNDGNSTQWVQISASPQLSAVRTARRTNLIINGALNVSQENGNTEGTASGYYAADQWYAQVVAATAAFGFGRVAATNLSGSQFRLRFRTTTAKVSLAATDLAVISTTLEGLNVQDLNWAGTSPKDAVLQFGFNGPAGTYAVALRNFPGPTHSFVSSFTISAGQANTDTVQTIRVPAPVGMTTWAMDNSASIVLFITLASGSTYLTATAGWNSGNFVGVTGMSNGLAAIQSFQVWDIGFYADPDKTAAPPIFEVPDYGTELLKCLRYYWKEAGAGAVGRNMYMPNTDGTTRIFTTSTPVPMRTAGTLSGTVSGGTPGFVGSATVFYCGISGAIAGSGYSLTSIIANARM